VRPEDEAPVEPVPTDTDDVREPAGVGIPSRRAVITIGGAPAGTEPDTAEEDDTIRPLSDRLVTELTAHRTLALRDGVANYPQVAFQAVLHALCLNAFYRYPSGTCLEITAKQSGFSAQAPGLAETASAMAIDARHAQWAKQLPETPADLWDTLTVFDSDSQAALFAHCASLTVNVVKEPWNRRPDAFAHGDQLARAVGLDMAATGWKPTVDNYLGRVPKARILEAVREAKGDHSAQLIDHLKKTEMAKEAERLLDGTGWLPEPLRLAGAEPAVTEPAREVEALPDFLTGEEEDADPKAAEPHAIAAE
jgi:ParB family chromosome partitioning protein